MLNFVRQICCFVSGVYDFDASDDDRAAACSQPSRSNHGMFPCQTTRDATTAVSTKLHKLRQLCRPHRTYKSAY